jgi:hypothetical protein
MQRFRLASGGLARVFVVLRIRVRVRGVFRVIGMRGGLVARRQVTGVLRTKRAFTSRRVSLRTLDQGRRRCRGRR